MAWMRDSLMRLAIPLTAALALMAAVAPPASAASAAQGEIKAYCRGDTPVIKSRPPGTEHITVKCENGLVQFVVTPKVPPAYNPLSQKVPLTTPPDFGGWVTVCINASQSPLIWYNVGRRFGKGCR